MATSNTATRESRRRKIVDRGANRLAFITGQIQTLGSKSRDSFQPLKSEPHRQDPPPHLSDQTAVPSNGEDGDFDSTLLNHDPSTDASHNGSSEEPLLPKCESIEASFRAPASDVRGSSRSSLALSADQNTTMSTSGTEQKLEPQRRQNRFVTPNQISSAISASERSRLLCSVTLALLVVLSYLEFPLLGSNIVKSVISFRPLYLVLSTNLTLVLVQLLFNNQRGHDHERAVGADYKLPTLGEYGWAERAGKALEVGLVIQKAIDAIFMDFSVYAIIIICGFSCMW